MEANPDIITKILDEDVELFTDKVNPNAVYVEYPLPNGARCFAPADNPRFEAFLCWRYSQAAKVDLCPPDLYQYFETRKKTAVYNQNNQITIHRRVAGNLPGGKIFYFLADEQWRCVFITNNGWHVVQGTKVKFLRGQFDEAQTEPIGGGNLLKLLRPFVNMDEDSFILFAAFLVQTFSRSSSHFAAVISSSKGTGKSTLTKLFRNLIDPSSADSALTPTSEGDLKVHLADSYVACFDNTGALSSKYSDILCAAITGTKAAKRKLYANADQIVLNLHNVIVINGIDIVPRRSDLADRSLLFELQSIPESKRKTDAAFWGDFKAKKAAILGAIFDTLVKAMQILPTLTFDKLPRMADAFGEMTAVAMALGIEQNEFYRIFSDSKKKLQEMYNQSSPLVECVLEYLRTHSEVNENVSSFYSKLQASIVGTTRFLPDSPSALSRKLNEEKDALFAAGYEFSRDRVGGLGYIKIRKIPSSQLTKAQKDAIARRKSLLDDAS